MNLFENNKIGIFAIVASALFLAVMPQAWAAEISQTYSLENGIVAHIYTPESIIENMTKRDDTGRLIFIVPDGLSYVLIEDISDPAITNKGDGSFHPLKPEAVLEALGEIDVAGKWMGLDVEVYLLPYLRSGCLASSAKSNMIFLSPGVVEINEYAQAYITTHELGHVYQNKYLADDDTERWTTYLTLREVYGDPDYCATACHMNRPKEIFAEDFRFLFGGAKSNYSHSIENPYLPLPDAVEGLKNFIAALVPFDIASGSHDLPDPPGDILSVSNYPNPFNPQTTIHVRLSGGSRNARQVDCTVYAVDGTVVRRLYGRRVTGTEIEISWDGTNDNGMAVTSGIYLYRIRCESDHFTGKMLLVR